ncbi:MAG: AI-2E family transporter [Flavobacteriales bacterium]|nr:AI-2E family transporter [Flavobacteriales bacterium]
MIQRDGLTRYTLTLLAVMLTITAMYFGRDLIVIGMFSGILTFLLLPLARGVERWTPRWVGALVATLTVVVIVLGLFFFMGWQFSRFGKDLPLLQESVSKKGIEVQRWVEAHTHFSRREQVQWFNEHLADITNWGGKAAMRIFTFTGSALTAMVPIPIFIFLLLLLRDRFRTFFTKLGRTSDGAVLDVMVRISELSRKYLRGILTGMLIFGILASTGFLFLGLKYAVLLGFVIAFLNIIPYIGALVGALLPVFLALITKDSTLYAVGALAVCLVVQFLDNNFITPKVVGSSVSINPLASLAALLGFGALWGVAGMLLAIPITGMLKVVCDSVPSLEPWGCLLGEEIETPKEKRLRIRFKRKSVQPPKSS